MAKSAALRRKSIICHFASPVSAWKRATPQAPDGYIPAAGECPPQRPSIRSAATLSDNETAWLEVRRNNTVWALQDLLRRVNITGLDTDAYISNNANNATALPNIGIALSGGGYRALMNGAGAIAAFDNRTENSTNQGQLGGLLQASTYISGLSGGSWLVGSLYVNNFTSVQAIINTNPSISGDLWQFDSSVLEGPATISTTQYYGDLYDDVNGKANAGFNTTITDYWGRALSFQLVNASDGGPAYTFSSVADDPEFVAATVPMPIIVADEREPGQLDISSNTTIFEFNPWELGTFDPTTFGFVPLRYSGSNFSGGVLPASEQCVRGFDNAGFIMGTSSSLFNQAFLMINSTSGAPTRLTSAINNTLADIGQQNNDIAAWPNPFYHYHNETNVNAQSKTLTLVDGGEDLQNIPLAPLIQRLRHVDVIFAIDSSADTSEPGANWPNGTALVATYRRSLNASIVNGTAFPSIPDQNTFVNLGLNALPTFFGCDPSNTTEPSPLIVYIPNFPYTYSSNVSTFDLKYSNTERNEIVQNGYDVATMGNGTKDSQWPTCVGCAILSRSLNRTGTDVPTVCTECFDRYCWNGTINSTVPLPYEPTHYIKTNDGASRATTYFIPLAVALCTSLLLLY
ncbi:hypothetical protein K432DRAFT_402926 [Lepidopterella palustris CBS 459.81]|uniref:Lysophospholipase n=1 Tax=Lepidopterella palustris CBS 459.81 TaxID=1314670 RepID=A0A8E2JH94_9PEZI|nr:hypothetical protein K432DRAFT_402926 [Lepidopterella palustris CBS 459.81]